jgi:hypothetical protein
MEKRPDLRMTARRRIRRRPIRAMKEDPLADAPAYEREKVDRDYDVGEATRNGGRSVGCIQARRRSSAMPALVQGICPRRMTGAIGNRGADRAGKRSVENEPC